MIFSVFKNTIRTLGLTQQEGYYKIPYVDERYVANRRKVEKGNIIYYIDTIYELGEVFGIKVFSSMNDEVYLQVDFDENDNMRLEGLINSGTNEAIRISYIPSIKKNNESGESVELAKGKFIITGYGEDLGEIPEKIDLSKTEFIQ